VAVVAVKQIIGLIGLSLQNNDKHLLAQWAKNLLNDDFFKEVIDNLKKEQISVIINTSAEECDRREDAYRHIKSIELITGHLEGLASETVIREKKWKIL
jgi:hypothetical protein